MDTRRLHVVTRLDSSARLSSNNKGYRGYMGVLGRRGKGSCC